MSNEFVETAGKTIVEYGLHTWSGLANTAVHKEDKHGKTSFTILISPDLFDDVSMMVWITDRAIGKLKEKYAGQGIDVNRIRSLHCIDYEGKVSEL